MKRSSSGAANITPTPVHLQRTTCGPYDSTDSRKKGAATSKTSLRRFCYLFAVIQAAFLAPTHAVPETAALEGDARRPSAYLRASLDHNVENSQAAAFDLEEVSHTLPKEDRFTEYRSNASARAANFDRILQNNGADVTGPNVEIIRLSNSKNFPLGFAIALGILIFVRLIGFGLVYNFRHHSQLRLAQPLVLGTLILAGSISIGSCYLLIYKDDLRCRMRDAMILTPLTLAGTILLGRVWRITILLTPVLQAKSSGYKTKKKENKNRTLGNNNADRDEDEDEPANNFFHDLVDWLKIKILIGMTSLADSYYIVSYLVGNILCGCCRGVIDWWILRRDMARELSAQPSSSRRRRGNTATALRKQVPVQQLVWVLFLLMIPQLTLQLCEQLIPAMQEKLEYEEILMTSTLVAERPVCRSEQLGSWPTTIGVALTILPYILTGILSWNAGEDLPKIFDDAQAMTTSFQFLGIVAIVAVPPLLFFRANEEPDTFVFLTSMLVLGMALPPVWFIVYPKVMAAMEDSASMAVFVPDDDMSENASVASARRHNQQHHSAVTRMLLRAKKSKKFLPSTAGDTKNQAKSATLALKIGKMYEEMGLHQKSIDLFDEALAVWHCDPNRDMKDQKIGGYTLDEISAFTVSDLECILQLLISKGRVEGTFHSDAADGQKSGAQAWLDALEIYERAPARANITDRSFLFPVFSGIFIFLKGGKIFQDEKAVFEQNLGRKFVRESRLQGDPIHYTKALAMFCETQARIGKYKAALETFQSLKDLYDPLSHSEGVSSAYGTDRSAQAFSQAALWQMELGRMDDALKSCEFVLDELMPSMDPTNTLNNCEMLLPLIRLHKPLGNEKRMRDLFNKYVVEAFYTHHGKDAITPCKPVFKPMLALLDICHDPENISNFEDLVDWLIEDEGGVMPDFLDSVYTKLCWSMHSLTAELCLRVSRRLSATNGDVGDVQILVSKGLDLAKKADKKMKKKGTVILPILYAIHEPIYKELKELASSLEMFDSEFELGSSKASGSLQDDSMARPKNLPMSYLRGRGSDSGSNSSNKGRPLSGYSLGDGSRDSKGNLASETIPEDSMQAETTTTLQESHDEPHQIRFELPPKRGSTKMSSIEFQSSLENSNASFQLAPGIPARPQKVPTSVEIQVDEAVESAKELEVPSPDFR